ncbi:unnamed protein product, partial [Effrenium voratum]
MSYTPLMESSSRAFTLCSASAVGLEDEEVEVSTEHDEGATLSIDERTNVVQEKVQADYWVDFEGIPNIPSSGFRGSRLFSWLCAVSICALLPWALLKCTSVLQSVHWQGELDLLDVEVSNCDLIFRPSAGPTSKVTLSYWTWRGGRGAVETGDGQLRVTLAQPARSMYFACHALSHGGSED